MPNASSSSQWLFTREELQDSPSARDGITPSEEFEARWKGCSFIQDTGKHLKMPMIAIATALVFFNRFYIRRSLRKYDHMVLAGACLFLSGKIEEGSFRKLRDIIRCTCMARTQRAPPEEDSDEFLFTRKILLSYEQALLDALCFDLVLEHPQPALLRCLEELRSAFEKETLVKIANAAWKLLNDTFRTQLSLLLPPATIAHSVLYLTLEHTTGNVHVRYHPDGGYWWQEVGLRSEDLESVAKLIFQLYQNSPDLAFFRDKHIPLEERAKEVGVIFEQEIQIENSFIVSSTSIPTTQMETYTNERT